MADMIDELNASVNARVRNARIDEKVMISNYIKESAKAFDGSLKNEIQAVLKSLVASIQVEQYKE